MALRLAKMYDLDLSERYIVAIDCSNELTANCTLDDFPGLASQRMSMCLHHLVRQRYVEGAITDSNMEDLVAAAVR